MNAAKANQQATAADLATLDLALHAELARCAGLSNRLVFCRRFELPVSDRVAPNVEYFFMSFRAHRLGGLKGSAKHL